MRRGLIDNILVCWLGIISSFTSYTYLLLLFLPTNQIREWFKKRWIYPQLGWWVNHEGDKIHDFFLKKIHMLLKICFRSIKVILDQLFSYDILPNQILANTVNYGHTVCRSGCTVCWFIWLPYVSYSSYWILIFNCDFSQSANLNLSLFLYLFFQF